MDVIAKYFYWTIAQIVKRARPDPCLLKTSSRPVQIRHNVCKQDLLGCKDWNELYILMYANYQFWHIFQKCINCLTRNTGFFLGGEGGIRPPHPPL